MKSIEKYIFFEYRGRPKKIITMSESYNFYDIFCKTSYIHEDIRFAWYYIKNYPKDMKRK